MGKESKYCIVCGDGPLNFSLRGGSVKAAKNLISEKLDSNPKLLSIFEGKNDDDEVCSNCQAIILKQNASVEERTELLNRRNVSVSETPQINLEVDDERKKLIEKVISSTDSPVGIDAKKTHIIIINKLDEIEKRLAKLVKRH